jgi:hypothetical protein
MTSCRSADFSDTAIQRLLQHAARLETLSLPLNRDVGDAVSMSDAAFLGAAAHCRALHTLHVQLMSRLSAVGTAEIGAMPALTALTLRNCYSVDDAAISTLLRGLGGGSSGADVSSDGGGCAQLLTLDICDNRQAVLSNGAFAALSRLPRLQRLRMRLCSQWTIGAQAFRALSSGACSATLTELDVWGCSQLDVAAFAAIAQCSSLRILNAGGRSSAIRKSDGEAVLTALSALPRLTALDLSHADWLNAANCAALQRFPALQTLCVPYSDLGDDGVVGSCLAQLPHLTALDLLRAVDSEHSAIAVLAHSRTLRIINATNARAAPLAPGGAKVVSKCCKSFFQEQSAAALTARLDADTAAAEMTPTSGK